MLKYPMRAIKVMFFALAIIAVLGFVGYKAAEGYYQQEVNAKTGSGELVNVEIPSGSSSGQIANILKENGILHNDFVFSLYLKEVNAGNQLKAGKYKIPNNVSIKEIVGILKAGADNQGLWVTIKEGLRYDEVSKAIAVQYKNVEKSLITESALNQIIEQPDSVNFATEVKQFLITNKPAGKPLEGFLYPDTYNFAKDANAQTIIETILKNFIAKVKNIQASNDATKFSFYENLTLASIAEKEYYPNPGDVEAITGIFIRRLIAGEKIGSDPTVLYPYKRWKPEPTAAELKKSTPYNTRLNYGLTPTPTSNPGLVAIKAAFSAKSGEYMFFIYDSQNILRLGKNLAEHNANIAKYLR